MKFDINNDCFVLNVNKEGGLSGGSVSIESILYKTKCKRYLP